MPEASAALLEVGIEPEDSSFEKLRPGPGRNADEVAEHQRARIQGAMIEATAAHGYPAVKVRALAQRAGVSSRTFYQHYSGKEECFLRTHEVAFRRLLRRIVLAQGEALGPRDRVRGTVATFLAEIARDPDAAKLMLVEVHAAGPAALEQLGRAERTLEFRVGESLDCVSRGVEMPPLMVKGIVAGMTCVTRTYILGERAAELPLLVDPITDWVMSMQHVGAIEVDRFDRQYEWGESAAKYPDVPASMSTRLTPSLIGCRASILYAVGKLVASGGYASLSTQAIRAAAGSSPRDFKANFDGVEDCFLEAVMVRTREALRDATAARAGAPTWAAGVHRAITSICRRVATDPMFASLCFDKALTPGQAGVRTRERLLGEIVAVLLDGMPNVEGTPEVALEASIGAIWGALQQLVAAGHASQAARVTGVLTYLATAPIIGSALAAAENRREIENATAQNLPTIDLDAILAVGQGHQGLPTIVMTTVTK